LESGEMLSTLKVLSNVKAIRKLTSKKFMTFSSENFTIKIWNVYTGECLQTINEKDVWCVDKLTDETIISGSGGHKIKIWNIETGLSFKSLDQKSPVTCLRVVSNDKVLSGTCQSFIIKLWSLENDCCIKTFVGNTDYVLNIQLISDKWFASVSRNKTIKLWDFETNCLKTFNDPNKMILKAFEIIIM